jgi:hypothetical protein
MQVILPPNMSQAKDDDLVVQDNPHVQWIDAAQAVGTVEVLAEKPSLADWSAWVDRVGGRWATVQELSGI